MSITSAIQLLKEEMIKAGIQQEQGLGTELFHFSSTLAPVVNVDLLITDENERVLLSWRDDDQTSSGWHVPGRCIRFRETIDDAIQRCAQTELGSLVVHGDEPIKVYEFQWQGYRPMVHDQRERAHFIALVYACKLPSDYSMEAFNLPDGQPGHMRWFETMPDDILPIQRCYKDDWKMLKDRIKTQKLTEDGENVTME